jgi:hypothetical protein
MPQVSRLSPRYFQIEFSQSASFWNNALNDHAIYIRHIGFAR